MAKILFLLTKLREESELERGGGLQRENQTERDRQTKRSLISCDEYSVLKTTQTLFTLMLGFEQRVNKK